MPLHLMVARGDVPYGVVPHMAHMYLAGGIGEHLKDVVLLLRGVGSALKRALLHPVLLPRRLYILVIISLKHKHLCLLKKTKSDLKKININGGLLQGEEGLSGALK